MINPLFFHRKCPVCSGTEYQIFFEVAAEVFFVERFGLASATIVKCSICGMKYTNPILKPAIDAIQYLEGEGYNRIDDRSPEALIWEDQIICYREIVAHTALKNKRILDVGCGEGGFVYLCQKNGLDAHGLELNKNAARRATSAGIRNIQCDKFEAVPNNSFDIITAIHVLEHLFDCREFALQTSRILREKGIAVIAVPNYFVYQYRFKQKAYWNEPFQHMNGLTSWTLDRLFGEFGFHRVPMKASFTKKIEGLTPKTRMSMVITKSLGNLLNLFPTKLICVYQLSDELY